jgi:hypothetical protein
MKSVVWGYKWVKTKVSDMPFSRRRKLKIKIADTYAHEKYHRRMMEQYRMEKLELIREIGKPKMDDYRGMAEETKMKNGEAESGCPPSSRPRFRFPVVIFWRSASQPVFKKGRGPSSCLPGD